MLADGIGLHVWHNASILTFATCIFSRLIITEAGDLKGK